MQIRIVRERTITTVGPAGLGSRIFSIGDVVDLPEIHARTFVADGVAVLDSPASKKPEATAAAAAPADAPTGRTAAAEAPQKPEPKQSRWGKKRN